VCAAFLNSLDRVPEAGALALPQGLARFDLHADDALGVDDLAGAFGGGVLIEQRLKQRLSPMDLEAHAGMRLSRYRQTFDDALGRVVAPHSVDGYDEFVRHLR
jgi:hypothetical protein